VKYVIGRAGFASYQQLRQAFHKHFHLSPENYRLKQKRAKDSQDKSLLTEL
jgi:transcriptional regulator GlxA family with amidase domain